MIIYKFTPSADYNLWLKCLDTQLNEPTNRKSQKLLNQQIGKHYYKTLGTSEINSPMTPPSLALLNL